MTDAKYLEDALQWASLRQGMTAPNPAVGAVILKEGRIIGTGFHEAPGQPHAEVVATQQASESVKGATLYVTLEPCCHQGRTAPCTEFILQQGFARVVYGQEDPNPQVAGKGAKYLQEAGIITEHLSLPSIEQFYRYYRHWWQHKKPWITAKLAMSLDGRIAGPKGVPVAITGPAAAEFTHEKRRRADGILTSISTVICDDPQFNVRLGSQTLKKDVLVIDPRAELPLTCRLHQTAKSITIFHAGEVCLERLKGLEQQGVHCIELPSQDLHLDLGKLADKAGELGYHHLWQETGGKIFANMIKAGLVQQAYFYVAPSWLGEEAQSAFNETNSSLFSTASYGRWQPCGNDMIYEMNW